MMILGTCSIYYEYKRVSETYLEILEHITFGSPHNLDELVGQLERRGFETEILG